MSETTSRINISGPKIPGYTIVKRLGDGGMSVVYLAMQESLKRHVGLKIMRVQGEVDSSMADRFIHEAETIAKLDHPNIVSIHDVGQAPDGSLFYTMPFLDHGDLRTFTPEHDRQLIALMQSLCDGLDYAHQHDVVHRDIKPENVLFDKFGTARIADFGIAITGRKRGWTKEGEVIGSAHYMSPEQCQANPVDARSDIYSLGVILFEMLTGKVPFDARDEVSILLAHVSDPIPLLPVELRYWQPLIARCLAKSPSHRFQSAEELKQALGRVPRTPWTRFLTGWSVTLKEFYARWRMRLFLGAGAVAALAAVVVAVYFWRLASMPPEPVLQPTIDPSPPPVATVSGPEPEPVAADPVPAEPEVPPEPPALSAEEALQLVDEGLERLAQDRLTRPEDDNAADRFLAVLDVYSDHPQAMDGLSALSNRFRTLITGAVEQGEYAQALSYAEAVVDVWGRAGVTTERFPLVSQAVLSAVSDAVRLEVNRIDTESARAALAVAQWVEPAASAMPELVGLIAELPEVGEPLADRQGVTTLVVPRVLRKQDGRTRAAEAGFAASPHEVTLDQYRAFADQRGWPESPCRRGDGPALFRSRNWRDPGVELADNHPVVCISWGDAIAYAEWLSARSGNLYRLPTESEWMHLAWAGHEADSACDSGNVGGAEAAHFIEEPINCEDQVVFTGPVGQFEANRVGIHDLRGNVREWVLDCAPTETGFNKFLDKLNIKEADRCERRAVRGTSWLDGRGASMLEHVDYVDANEGRPYVGFRVIRDLEAERQRSRSRG